MVPPSTATSPAARATTNDSRRQRQLPCPEDETALLVTAGLCVLAIAAIIVTVSLEERGRVEQDEHEETGDCRN